MPSIPLIPEYSAGGRQARSGPLEKIRDVEPLDSHTPGKSTPRPNQESKYDSLDPSKSTKCSSRSQETSPPDTPLYNEPSPARQPKQYSLDQLHSLQAAADGLLTKLYGLKKALHLPAEGSMKPSDVLWKAGILPDLPELCTIIAQAFPRHPRDLSLEKVCMACRCSSSFRTSFYVLCSEDAALSCFVNALRKKHIIFF